LKWKWKIIELFIVTVFLLYNTAEEKQKKYKDRLNLTRAKSGNTSGTYFIQIQKKIVVY